MVIRIHRYLALFDTPCLHFPPQVVSGSGTCVLCQHGREPADCSRCVAKHGTHDREANTDALVGDSTESLAEDSTEFLDANALRGTKPNGLRFRQACAKFGPALWDTYAY